MNSHFLTNLLFLELLHKNHWENNTDLYDKILKRKKPNGWLNQNIFRVYYVSNPNLNHMAYKSY